MLLNKVVPLDKRRVPGSLAWNAYLLAESDTNNMITKAQVKKVQRSFQPVKTPRKLRNLIF